MPFANWKVRARCRGMDTDTLFFPVSEKPDHRGGDRPAVAKAKAVCAACPVAAWCLLEALNNRDVYGVRGGTTGPERAAMLRQQRKESA